MKKFTPIILILLVIIILGGIYYWFFLRKNTDSTSSQVNTDSIVKGFNPFNRGGNNVTPQTRATSTTTSTSTDVIVEETDLPKLRKISESPVGGMAASSTVLRYIDRGLGHIYEIEATSTQSEKISNTTIPKVYESYWNKNLNQVVLRYLKVDSNEIVNFFGDIRPIKIASGTPESTTKYEVKGKFLSKDIKNIVLSPKGDKIFTFNIENGRGVGYISNFDESKKTKVFDTPLTQVWFEWPQDATIVMYTNSSNASWGYVYQIDTKTGSMKKITQGNNGFDAKLSLDLKKVFYSSTNSGNLKNYIYDIGKNKTTEVLFTTLPEKCVWSNLRKNEAYCAVPTSLADGVYPDDWYRGNISFNDQIWHIDTDTGEVHMLVSPINTANERIDAINLLLDQKENYLYFINKNDLNLWSLNLNK